jgi:tetratricopeptide (TPR) repeat protein
MVLSFVAIAQEETSLEKGIRLYREAEYSKSVSALQELVQSSPSKMAWTYLGAALVRSAKEAEAVEAFTKAEKYKFDKNDDAVDKPMRITRRFPCDMLDYGRVKLAVEFQSDGKIGFVLPINSSASKQYINSCISAAKKIVFEPAEKLSKPVSRVTIVEYSTR